MWKTYTWWAVCRVDQSVCRWLSPLQDRNGRCGLAVERKFANLCGAYAKPVQVWKDPWSRDEMICELGIEDASCDDAPRRDNLLYTVLCVTAMIFLLRKSSSQSDLQYSRKITTWCAVALVNRAGQQCFWENWNLTNYVWSAHTTLARIAHFFWVMRLRLNIWSEIIPVLVHSIDTVSDA